MDGFLLRQFKNIKTNFYKANMRNNIFDEINYRSVSVEIIKVEGDIETRKGSEIENDAIIRLHSFLNECKYINRQKDYEMLIDIADDENQLFEARFYDVETNNLSARIVFRILLTTNIVNELVDYAESSGIDNIWEVFDKHQQ